jgi:hypothetical protein
MWLAIVDRSLSPHGQSIGDSLFECADAGRGLEREIIGNKGIRSFNTPVTSEVYPFQSRRNTLERYES